MDPKDGPDVTLNHPWGPRGTQNNTPNGADLSKGLPERAISWTHID